MNKLLFIRHGATAGNLKKRYIGPTDEALCDLGFTQIRELKKQNFQVDKLFVSPMLRTKQSAEILFPEMEYTVVEDFRETDFGIFEGKTAFELSGNPHYQAWVDSYCQDPVPGGESVTELKNRCCEAFQKVMSAVEDEASVGFIVHGGTIMAILEAFAESRRNFYDYHIGNGEWSILEYGNGVIVGW